MSTRFLEDFSRWDAPPDDVLPEELSPFERGKLDFSNGARLEDNPYFDVFRYEREEWDRGWNEADTEY